MQAGGRVVPVANAIVRSGNSLCLEQLNGGTTTLLVRGFLTRDH